jgi:NAD(P)-dependent dehydrogenase (short-subunit alcohol dehydrogenase family)
VTGAGRGLGEAYAELLASRGAAVVVNDAGVEKDGSGADPEPAETVAARIAESGGTALADSENLSDRRGCEALIHRTLARFGRVDALVHSAGLVGYGAFEELDDLGWHRLRSVNVDAAVWLARAVWPHMIERGYGRVVLTTSGYGLRPYADSDVTAYGVGKAAQFGLMNGLSGEGGRHGILVNCVSPVATTRMLRQTSAQAMEPARIAPVVALLASSQCPFSGKIIRAVAGRFQAVELASHWQQDLGSADTVEGLLAAARASSGASS